MSLWIGTSPVTPSAVMAVENGLPAMWYVFDPLSGYVTDVLAVSTVPCASSGRVASV